MGNMLDCGTDVGGPLPSADDGADVDGEADLAAAKAHAVREATLALLEGPTPLRDSMLWNLQRKFYDEVNIKAWSQSIVPNFVTSNAFIARTYSNVVLGLMRDLFDPASAVSAAGGGSAAARGGAAARPRGNPAEPLYIVEVGAGHGQMSYLMVKALLALKEVYPPHEREYPFVYVMTDFTQHNVDFWLAHRQLAPLVEAGVLDMALYNAETDDSIKLINSGVVLSAESMASGNPIVAITNYVFDTLTTDAFRVADGEVQQAMVSVSSPEEADTDTPLNPDVIRRMQCEFTYEAVDEDDDFYGDDDFNYIVRAYQERMTDASCLVPIGGLRMIRGLASIGAGRLMLIAGDKGYHTEAEMAGFRHPHIARHGSFSMMVNFHALQLYFERRGGFSLHSSHQDGFKTATLFLGVDKPGTLHARWAFEDCMKEFGPENFSTLQRCVKDETAHPSLPTILALLRLSRCDASLFYKFKQVLLDKATYDTLSENVTADMLRDISGVSNSYYALLRRKDVCFEVGRLLMSMKHYAEACKFFESSNMFCGEHHVTWHNLGICMYYCGNLPAALKCFSRSGEMNPKYVEARTWHRKVTREMVLLSSAGTAQDSATTSWGHDDREDSYGSSGDDE